MRSTQRLGLSSKQTVEVTSNASIGQDREMEWLTDAGLGLDYEVLRLERTSQLPRTQAAYATPVQ